MATPILLTIDKLRINDKQLIMQITLHNRSNEDVSIFRSRFGKTFLLDQYGHRLPFDIPRRTSGFTPEPSLLPGLSVGNNATLKYDVEVPITDGEIRDCFVPQEWQSIFRFEEGHLLYLIHQCFTVERTWESSWCREGFQISPDPVTLLPWTFLPEEQFSQLQIRFVPGLPITDFQAKPTDPPVIQWIPCDSDGEEILSPNIKQESPLNRPIPGINANVIAGIIRWEREASRVRLTVAMQNRGNEIEALRLHSDCPSAYHLTFTRGWDQQPMFDIVPRSVEKLSMDPTVLEPGDGLLINLEFDITPNGFEVEGSAYPTKPDSIYRVFFGCASQNGPIISQGWTIVTDKEEAFRHIPK